MPHPTDEPERSRAPSSTSATSTAWISKEEPSQDRTRNLLFAKLAHQVLAASLLATAPKRSPSPRSCWPCGREAAVRGRRPQAPALPLDEPRGSTAGSAIHRPKAATNDGSSSSGIGVVVSRSRGGDCFPLSRPRSTIEIVGRSSARAAGWTLSRRGRIVGVRCCPSASSELTFAPRASRR